MSVKQRKSRNYRKKIIWYFLYLFVLGLLVFSYYYFNLSKNGTFISPLAKSNNKTQDNVEKKLKESSIPYSEIESNSDSSYTITSDQGGEIILSSKKDLDTQISSLQRILRELTMRGKGFKNIDFRFEKPVVEFSE
ncbi:MAG: hypothetical protein HYT07_02800 [Candidatus Levybacteria bacterium]|nr:hypothetical protein [Candidatus Levybacteria bacterium]